MGVISRPPSPAFEYFSICAVKSCGVPMLPSHHQRVHGFVVDVISGQSRSAARAGHATATSNERKNALRMSVLGRWLTTTAATAATTKTTLGRRRQLIRQCIRTQRQYLDQGETRLGRVVGGNARCL